MVLSGFRCMRHPLMVFCIAFLALLLTAGVKLIKNFPYLLLDLRACRLMEIPKSTYYYKPKSNLEKKKHNADIANKIEAIAYDFPSYGYRRITAALKRQGILLNHKKVAKIMKKMGIQCRKAKRFASTTNSNHS